MPELGKLYRDADSRLRGYFGQVSHPTMSAQRVYCHRCGKPAGYCSTESSKHIAPLHIVVTCDECDAAMLQAGYKPVPQHMLDAFGLLPEPVAEITSTEKTGFEGG
jgi:hypothetical protein